MKVKVPITDLLGPDDKGQRHPAERSEGLAGDALRSKATSVHNGCGDGVGTQVAGIPGDAAGPFGSRPEWPRDLVLGGES